jgi:hypothetical protein
MICKLCFELICPDAETTWMAVFEPHKRPGDAHGAGACLQTSICYRGFSDTEELATRPRRKGTPVSGTVVKET